MSSLDIVIPALNAGRSIGATLDRVFDQDMPASVELGVIVVDNGSTDDTAAEAGRHGRARLRLVSHDRERSRAAALNAGVEASEADYVMLLDADCRLIGKSGLRVVAGAMAERAAAAFGYTATGDEAGLGPYLASLEADRKAAGWLGWTTACCIVRRENFLEIGGFSTDYTHYGFEDRDFICRLRAGNPAGGLRSLPELRAEHDAPATLGEVRHKMYTSGRYSSGPFMRRFPETYALTDYARVDADLAPFPRAALLRVAAVFEPPLGRIADALLRGRILPTGAGRQLIRLVSALGYYRGTRDRETPPRAPG